MNEDNNTFRFFLENNTNFWFISLYDYNEGHPHIMWLTRNNYINFAHDFYTAGGVQFQNYVMYEFLSRGDIDKTEDGYNTTYYLFNSLEYYGISPLMYWSVGLVIRIENGRIVGPGIGNVSGVQISRVMLCVNF